MHETAHHGRGRTSAARRDMALIVVISAAAAIIRVQFDLSEAMMGWTRLHENLQLDELLGILLVVAACLIWFSTRRYLDASRELDLRRATEARMRYDVETIAEKLGVSPKTAANRQTSIKQKLGAGSALQLILIAQQFGLGSGA